MRGRRAKRQRAMGRENTGSPHAWPSRTVGNCLLLAAVSVLFFYQVFLHPDLMLWGNDSVRADSTFKQAIWRSVWHWRSLPLWDPTIFCGKSIVGDPIYALVNPPSLIFWLTPNPILLGFFVWFHVTLGAWGTFLFARKMGCDALGAFFAAVAFAMAGKTAAHVFAGHILLVPTAMGLPWMLWAVENLLEKKRLASALLLGVVLAVVVSYGAVHIIYVNMLFTTAYAVLRIAPAWLAGERRRALHLLLLCMVGMLVFVGVSAAWWLPIVRQTLLLSARSAVRDISFAAMGGATPRDLLRFIWPFGGIPLPRAFVSDAEHLFFWETASYPGVTTVCLALAALVSLKRERRVLVFGCVALLALVLALADSNPLFWLAYHITPGFKLFRGWGRLFFYVNFMLAILAGSFLSKAAAAKAQWPTTLVLFIMLQAVFLLTLAMRDSPLAPARGRWVPLLVLVILTACAFFWASGDLSIRFWRGLSVCLLLGELFLCWGPHIQVVDTNRAIPPYSAAKFLAQASKEEFRILDTTFMIEQQVAARHGLEIITGYHPGIYAHHLEMYRNIWRRDHSDIVELLIHPPQEIVCPVVLDLMNVRYLVSVERELGPAYQQVYQSPPGELRRVRYVYRRDTALPRAFLVARAEVPPHGLTVLDAICSIDPRELCLVDDRPFVGSAEFRELPIDRRSPSDITLRFTTEEKGVVVISQTWHPDWRARDNGNPVEVRRVNHAQVGVPVEAGEHELRVWYYPWDFYLGCIISAVTWIGMAVFVLFSRRIRKPASRDAASA